jgi:hypothetical protein
MHLEEQDPLGARSYSGRIDLSHRGTDLDVGDDYNKKNRLQWEIPVPAWTERTANVRSTGQNHTELLKQTNSFLPNESNFFCLQVSERLRQRINRNKIECYAE